jgi:hypothetical protein
MKKANKKPARSQSSQLSMKSRVKADKSINDIEIILGECCKDLDDDTLQIGINPLPTPAFVHFEACNLDTPRVNFCPGMAPGIKLKAKEMMGRVRNNET